MFCRYYFQSAMRSKKAAHLVSDEPLLFILQNNLISLHLRKSGNQRSGKCRW
jgi:hypothetical protein